MLDKHLTILCLASPCNERLRSFHAQEAVEAELRASNLPTLADMAKEPSAGPEVILRQCLIDILRQNNNRLEAEKSLLRERASLANERAERAWADSRAEGFKTKLQQTTADVLRMGGNIGARSFLGESTQLLVQE